MDGDVLIELDGAPLNDIAAGIGKLKSLRASEGFTFKTLRGGREKDYDVFIR